MANDKFFRKVKRIKPIEPKKARRIRRSDTMFFYRQIKSDIKDECRKGGKNIFMTCGVKSHTYRAVRLFAMKNKGFVVIRHYDDGIYNVLIDWNKKD